MEMLKLLNTEDFTRFYLRSDLVEKIVPARGNCSEILLTTGRRVLCGESPDQVAQMVMAAEQPLALDLRSLRRKKAKALRAQASKASR